jgi:NAD(P)H-dependent FMN reductase
MLIVGICGSLRAQSHNLRFLQAAQRRAGALSFEVAPSLGALPLFNPDFETSPPAAVAKWRSLIGRADAVVIASPEYAHGVSGVLKNALDWLVGGPEFHQKPVALFNASPRASHALASLREIVTTMAGRIIEPACIALPLLGGETEAATLAEHPQSACRIDAALAALAFAVPSPGVFSSEVDTPSLEENT